jgi:phospholipid-binding lipoprotein MlaA
MVLALFSVGCAHNPKPAGDQEVAAVAASQTSSEASDEAKAVSQEQAPVTEDQEGTAAVSGATEPDPYADLDFEDEETTTPVAPDPLVSWNRAMFVFNDATYTYFLKPVTKGYKTVTPYGLRLGLRNFFNNLETPLRLVSSVLQGKGRLAAEELGAFLVNSTIGIFGMATPANDIFGWNPGDEDLGQTFGVWGIGNGPYIVWPFFGPSTIRDSVGDVLGSPLDLLFYVDPMELHYGAWGVKQINKFSFWLGDYDAMKKMAVDPYESVRDFYIRFREKKVAK